MFAVIFESRPDAARLDAYADIARSLRPDLAANPGFVENPRYRSLARPGWLLSLSIWRDEKALVHWRTRGRHHLAQESGRAGVLDDYHLRVGQIVRTTPASDGHDTEGERVDETAVGEAKYVVLVDGLTRKENEEEPPETIAAAMGLDVASAPSGLLAWDVMDAIESPGETILLTSWADEAGASGFCDSISTSRLRCRLARILRDYGKYDRREAPQYYEDAPGQPTVH